MRQIDIILLSMRGDLNNKQFKKLENVLEKTLLPSHCDKSDESVINAYLENCRFRNLSEQSIKVFGGVLRELSKFSQYNLVDYDHNIIKDYLSSKKSTCCIRTLATKRTYINNFYAYLVLEEWITFNPVDKVPKIKVPSKHKVGISDIELAQAMKYVTNDRDVAIIEFMKSTGCRISEVAKVKYGNFDFKNRTVFIHQAKGQKDRTVSFDVKCEKALRKYLKPFPTRDDDEPMFLRRARNKDADYLYESKGMTVDGVKDIFLQIKKMSGVKKFHAHALRHYCITKLLSNKMPLKMVSMQAGHASVKTTLDVYDDVTLNDMQREYRKAMC